MNSKDEFIFIFTIIVKEPDPPEPPDIKTSLVFSYETDGQFKDSYDTTCRQPAWVARSINFDWSEAGVVSRLEDQWDEAECVAKSAKGES